MASSSRKILRGARGAAPLAPVAARQGGETNGSPVAAHQGGETIQFPVAARQGGETLPQIAPPNPVVQVITGPAAK